MKLPVIISQKDPKLPRLVPDLRLRSDGALASRVRMAGMYAARMIVYPTPSGYSGSAPGLQ